jgi:hypothetical protein
VVGAKDKGAKKYAGGTKIIRKERIGPKLAEQRQKPGRFHDLLNPDILPQEIVEIEATSNRVEESPSLYLDGMKKDCYLGGAREEKNVASLLPVISRSCLISQFNK